MKVLSLFDGISCLRVALGDRDIDYTASEIDKNAIKISKKNYPDIKHIGSVVDVPYIPDLDLLCGGTQKESQIPIVIRHLGMVSM